MASRKDRDLLQTLRDSGLRKKVAQSLTDVAGNANRGKQPKVVTRAVKELRTAAGELEKRVGGSTRSKAAKKAAQTRKRKAAQRSAAARKAAKTRAKNA